MSQTASNKNSQVNGDIPESQTLKHFTSYPLVADGISFYKSNSLGARSIAMVNNAYDTFASPVIPYLRQPIHYLAPYIVKIDSLGDQSLSTVDSHFPQVKKTDYNQLKSYAFATAHYPFKLAGETRGYVHRTFDEEHKKINANGDAGLVGTGKAIISTELRIVAESLHVVGDWLKPRVEKAESEFEKLRADSEQKVRNAVDAAHSKREEAQAKVEAKAQAAKGEAKAQANKV